MNWLLIWGIVFFLNCFGAYINYLNNVRSGFFVWACVLSVISAPLFPLISKYSKNLIVDGLVYDVIIFFAYTFTLILLGCSKILNAHQWLGFVLTVIGFLLMKF
jgi:hypothetical protein